MQNTLRKVLHDSAVKLTPHTDTPQLDATLLLEHALKTDRTFLYTHPEYQLTSAEMQTLNKLLERRARGEPIAYILGYKEFWSLALKVTPDTLIPRPETELLVELTLKLFSADKPMKLLDLGTGSGAIALALAHDRPHWQIIAVDQSNATLAIAQENAKALGISNVQFIHSHWFENIPPQHFDAIVSNPPYLADHDPHLLTPDLQFEPRGALVSSDNGLADFKKIIESSVYYLTNEGYLILEHGYQQGQEITTLLQLAGFQDYHTYQDLAGNDRVTLAKTPTHPS